MTKLDHILVLNNFSVSLNNKVILDSLDLLVASSGITVIMGPSGTGKSTLLRTLAGLNELNSAFQVCGQVLYNGTPIQEQSVRPALVLQKVAQVVSTVQESLLSNLPNRSRMMRMEQLAVLEQFCRSLGQLWVLDKLNDKVVQLELHEQRMLAIIREMLAEPALLMLDEPTAGLQAAAEGLVCQFIQTASIRQPILMVSHNLMHCRQLARQVVLIASGSVQESSLVEDFFSAPSSESAKVFLRTGSCPECSRDIVDDGEDEMSVDRLALSCTDSATAIPGLKSPLTVQPRMQANSQFMGPRGFLWLVRGRIAGTPWPGIMAGVQEDLSALRDVGISHLVSLTEQPFPQGLAAPFSIQVSHFPIDDMSVPSLQDAMSFCQLLDELVSNNATVAVHCRAGLGRTGTMLAVYLMWMNQGRLSATHAISYIHALNAQMIQSEMQFSFIRNFAGHLMMT